MPVRPYVLRPHAHLHQRARLPVRLDFRRFRGLHSSASANSDPAPRRIPDTYTNARGDAMNTPSLPMLTPAEDRVYRLAVKLFRSAASKIRAEVFVNSTLGAQIGRTRGFT